MKRFFAIIGFLLCSIQVFSQSNPYSFQLKKGQVLDVLPLKFNEKADPEKQAYYLRKAILPRALELGYIPHSSISISESSQGNYTPDVLLFGGWGSESILKNAMETLESEFPDFHPLRREIWTVFYNTHYIVEVDQEITFHPGKFYSATSYWNREGKDFKGLKEYHNELLEKNNGSLILGLENGFSPYGYYYKPDYFFILEWPDQASFEKFKKEIEAKEKSDLKQIHQFLFMLPNS